MAVFIYRPQSSSGARVLAEALNGTRVRGFQNTGGRNLFYKNRDSRQFPIQFQNRDKAVSWGAELHALPRNSVLNGAAIRSKYTDAVTLRGAGVPTIEVTNTRPPNMRQAAAPAQADPSIAADRALREAVEEYINATYSRNRVYRDGVQQITNRATALFNALGTPFTAAPAVTAAEWLPRENDHVGGSDLLTPTREPDYWVKKLEFVKEYRIHSFLGKSIRAGVKAPREGMTAHPWIRSWDGGWSIRYDGVSSKKKHRELAHRAVAALGLDFGAVDIGEMRDGTLIVLEVNRAPGLDGTTPQIYAGAIQKWVSGEWARP